LHTLKTLPIFLFLLLFPFLASCGTSDKNNEQSDDAIGDNLTVFGGSVGGVWSVFTEGVSEAVRKENPGTLISAVPGTVAGNPVAVSEGKADFAISESLTAYFAYEGDHPFEESHENIRAVAAIMPINVFQFVAPANVEFDSIENIADDNIG